jgi:hypothetical protein
MLQPRNLLRLRQCVSPVNIPSPLSHRHLSISRRAFQDNAKPSSAIFIPTVSVNAKPSFKQSPTSQPLAEDNKVYGSSSSHYSPSISIDNFLDIETRQLPQTGPLSGRSVSCRPGRVGTALVQLNKIVRENNIAGEHRKSQQRFKPSTARRMLRSKRHRIRFKQGIARLAEIVLKMRKKSY